VLESGMGDPAAPWFAVERALAGMTRVCSYDRAGTLGGASDPAPTPRTGADAVADLHALLAAAAVPGPYVLVGHSLGGLLVRLYAHTYPDEVAGLVLVDAPNEEVFARLEALLGPERWAQFQALLAEGFNPEGVDRAAIDAELQAARAVAPLRPMPLVVVSADKPFDPADAPPGWPPEADPLRRKLQDDLARLVPGGRHVVTDRSGHYIHKTEPELVVAAIRETVEAVRRGSTEATLAT
jgi:pimeloyl-ACP methyl ester carboxylesterase